MCVDSSKYVYCYVDYTYLQLYDRVMWWFNGMI